MNTKSSVSQVAKTQVKMQLLVFMSEMKINLTLNKACHRDRIACLTDLAHHIKNFNVKLFINGNADAGGGIIALPGLHPGELKSQIFCFFYVFKLQ